MAVAMTCNIAERMPDRINGSAQGELHVPQDFRAAHTHAHGSIACGRLNSLDAGVRARQDRGDGQDDQHQTGRRQEGDLTAQPGSEPEEGQIQQAQ